MAGIPTKAAALLVILLLSLVGFTAGSRNVAGALTQSAALSVGAGCGVTLPNRTVRPGAGFGPGGFNYGNARLRAHLTWARGVLRAGPLPTGGSIATINRDGSISAKVGWWVRDVGKLVIVGWRLDRPASPLWAEIPPGYGPAYDMGASVGFQPASLTFPTLGCWRVVGKAGTARLTFVVKVTKLK